MSTVTETPSAVPPRDTPRRTVTLLPDDRFVVRRVPIEQGEGVGGVLEQLELAVEALAPFPLAQVAWGYWTRPGAGHALVFAAYRKRFTAEELEAWGTSDLVMPRFAAWLGAEAPAGATTWVLGAEGGEASAEAGAGVTLVYFDDESGVPARVESEPTREAVEGENEAQVAAERAAWREAALRRIGETRRVVEVNTMEVEPGPPGEGAFQFRATGLSVELPLETAEQLDVRDRGELAGRRRARVRDRWLWRGLLAAAAVVLVCGLAEVGLAGLAQWQKGRLARVAEQGPVVSQIMTAQTLAVRIDELSTKRLRPFEMIGVVDSQRPESIQFLRTITQGLDTLVVNAQTSSQPDIDAYRSALAALPGMRSVEVRDLNSREGRSTFTLVATFEPAALARVSEELAASGVEASGEGKGPGV